jgi:hypothetical protein
MFPLSINLYFEMAALLTSVICIPALRKTKLRWFPIFLLFIVTLELYGRYLSKTLKMPNAWLYNLSTPIEYLFYFYLFYKVYKSARAKKIAMALATLFLLSTIFLHITKGIYLYNDKMLLMGNILAIVLCCYYFYQIFFDEERLSLLKEPMFWIASGILLFNAGELLYTIFLPVLQQHNLDESAKLFYLIHRKLVPVLFTSYIIGFLCTQKLRQLKMPHTHT